MIIYSVLDGTVVAVNATTGKLVWRAKLGDPTVGETLTDAPIVVNNKVIVGNSGGESGVRGWIQALDVNTGKTLWKAYNTGPDADVLIDKNFHPFYAKDQGTDLGASTWPGTMWQQGGATSWGWLTYDPELNLLYHGTANPGVWNPDMRPGDNKWSSTIFARNPDTGKAVWAYQLTPHDGWDFDAINEDIVADLPLKGAVHKVIVHFNKNGFAYTIDRRTGKLLVAQPFGNVTWATGVDLGTGMPGFVPSLQPHQGAVTSGICPTPEGAKDWEPSAFSPATNLFYVPSINFCYNLEPLLALYIAGTPFFGASFTFAPGPRRVPWTIGGVERRQGPRGLDRARIAAAVWRRTGYRRKRRVLRHARQAIQGGERNDRAAAVPEAARMRRGVEPDQLHGTRRQAAHCDHDRRGLAGGRFRGRHVPGGYRVRTGE
ncbi:MAG: PQQ-binding-like beta-propeller repeat protein [Rhodospirillales bacterium]